jgi:hypothetical protein
MAFGTDASEGKQRFALHGEPKEERIYCVFESASFFMMFSSSNTTGSSRSTSKYMRPSLSLF